MTHLSQFNNAIRTADNSNAVVKGLTLLGPPYPLVGRTNSIMYFTNVSGIYRVKFLYLVRSMNTILFESNNFTFMHFESHHGSIKIRHLKYVT